jgi:hypothetical protein
MADSIALLSYGKQGPNAAKAGCARAGFTCCKWGERKGGCGWVAFSYFTIVVLGSLVSYEGSRGHSRAMRCSSFLFLVNGKR